MKNILFIAGLLPALCLPSHAECRYFRDKAAVQQCKEVNPADLKSLDRDETDIPELPESTHGKLMRVRCSCEYKLSGANPFCDLEQTQELHSVMGTDNADHPCAGAKTFCDTLCPQTYIP